MFVGLPGGFQKMLAVQWDIPSFSHVDALLARCV